MRRLVPLVLLWALAAGAHDADVIYVSVQQGPAPDRLGLVATLTPASLALLAPVDADGDGALSQADLDARAKAIRLGFWEDAPLSAGGQRCELLETGAALREGFVELFAQARCGEGELRQDFKVLRVLPANYRVVLGSQLDGEARGRGFAQGSLTAITIPRPARPGAWDREAFGRAVEEGLARALSAEVLAGLVAVLFAAGAWRKGARWAALLCAAAALASGVPGVPREAAHALLGLTAVGAAVLRTPPVFLPLLLGVAIGVRDGGGGWVRWLGLAAASAVLALLAAAPVALGVLVARRPAWWARTRWVPALAALVALARLSW